VEPEAHGEDWHSLISVTEERHNGKEIVSSWNKEHRPD